MRKRKLRYKMKVKLLWMLSIVILICLYFVYIKPSPIPIKDVLGETYIKEKEPEKNFIHYDNTTKELKAFYSDITELTTKYPLLVNKSNKLPDDFVPDNLVEIVKGHKATSKTKDAYIRMRSDAIANGLIIKITSAYRSIEYQRVLYNKSLEEQGKESTDRQVARPGHSEHHTGRALDLIGSFGGLDDFGYTPESKWISEHAHEYGFIIRYGFDTENITGYSYEPWHITYVGETIAQEMIQKNIKSLEEYITNNSIVENEFYD